MAAYTDPKSVCAPWISSTDLCCEGNVGKLDCDGVTITPLTYKWTDDELILAASNMLFARTCYRYPGSCTATVWPCVHCACHCHPCACALWYKIDLPTDYPILSVDEVRIDGVPMNTLDYRLDNSKWLVRIDGQPWPLCNSFGLPNTTSSEIQVDYTMGRTPPIELRMACGELVCELKKACEGSSDCSLPTSVKTIVRRGVAMDLRDVTDLLSTSQTGNPIIDHALKIHGNCSQHGKLFDPARQPRGYGV